MANTKRYPPSRCIAIDVDGTLVVKGELDARIPRWAAKKKAEGFEVLLWSARGSQYARSVAMHFKIVECFTNIVSKPGYIVDDLGWSWVQYTTVIKELV